MSGSERSGGIALLEATELLSESLGSGDLRRDQERAIREIRSDLKPIAEAVRSDEIGEDIRTDGGRSVDGTQRKAYENHHVTPAPENGYQSDTFRCGNIDGWVTTEWLVFNYCPLCGQELEDRQYTPDQSVPLEGI